MTNRDTLLEAAMLCRMMPGGGSVHRYQLFYVIHGELQLRIGVNDLQRALETATKEGLFGRPTGAADGRVTLTESGHKRAHAVRGTRSPIFAPVGPGSCQYTMTSPDLDGHRIQLHIVDGRFNLTFDGKKKTGKEVVEWLNRCVSAGITLSTDSMPRRVYDFGVASGWSLRWTGTANAAMDPLSPVVEALEPTDDADELLLRVAMLQAFRASGGQLPIPPGNAAPTLTTGSTRRWMRLPAVVDYVLARSNGQCELCNASPFLTAKGTVFLEIHHVKRLADGGPDQPDNAVALCPNCHRALHYAKDYAARCVILFQRVPGLRKH